MNTQVLVEDVWKSFDRGRIEVLKGVALKVPKGEIIALCGTSGCGKSTLLNVISGLEEVDRGNVRVSGYDVVRESTRVDLLRHHIGYVFQFHHLMPDLTLAENCMVPVIAAGGNRADSLARLHELAVATGVEHRLGQRVRELSGGERQRGALVRASEGLHGVKADHRAAQRGTRGRSVGRLSGRGRRPSRARRMKVSTDCSASLQSIHSKPADSKSSWCKAGSSR